MIEIDRRRVLAGSAALLEHFPNTPTRNVFPRRGLM